MTLSAKSLGPAMLILAIAAGCGGKSEADSMNAARLAISKRDHAAAVIELKSVLQKTPDVGEARYLLGVALMEQGENAPALLELKKAQELSFNEELLAPKIARALLSTGRFKEVVEAYSGTSMNNPASLAELKTALAIAHARLGQRPEATAAIAAALVADPKFPWALLTKARIAAANGQFDEALALAEQAVVPGAGNGDAHMLRGAILNVAKLDAAGAIKAYELAAEDPKEALGARGALIQVMLGQGKLSEAQSQLAMLKKSHPKNAQTAYLDAVVAFAANDFARAEVVVEQLLRFAPDSTALLVLGGASSLQRGALISAETKLGKVVQTVERVPVARKLLAETYLRMGQSEKALATLRPVLEQAKPDAGALALAGQAHLQAGNAQEAEASFLAAVKIRPDDVQVRTALALTDLMKGNSASAFDALEGIAASDPGETADLALISAHLRRREHDLALTAIARLEAKQPDKPVAPHLRGLALRGKGDMAGARKAFEAAVKAQPEHFASVSALVALDVREGKFNDARQRLETSVKANPKNVGARMAQLDLMVHDKAKPEAVLAAIDEAIKAAPTDAAPHVAKVMQLSRMSDVKAAASAAQTAMAALPNQPEVLDAAGRAFSSAGDDQQAISAFNKMASILPRSAVPHIRLADLHAKRGDTPAVWSSLNRAYEAAPESAEVHKRLLSSATTTKDFRPAMSIARDLQKRRPNSALGFLLEGDLEVARKAWLAAAGAYRTALGKPESSGRAQARLYDVLIATGDKVGAERFAGEWLKSNPNDVRFLEHLGGYALLKKDYLGAERRFAQAVNLQPKNPAALNNLAWLMAERGVKGAVEMAERAASAAPAAAPVMDTLAKALAAEGDLKRAIEAQQRAVVALPERHVYRLNLAKLYAKAGEKGKALEELEALARLESKFPHQDEVSQLRQSLSR